MSRRSRARAAVASGASVIGSEQALIAEAFAHTSANAGSRAARLVERLALALRRRQQRDMPADLPVLTQEALGAVARARAQQVATGSASALASADRDAFIPALHASVRDAFEQAMAARRTESGSHEYVVRTLLALSTEALRAAEEATERQGLEHLHA